MEHQSWQPQPYIGVKYALNNGILVLVLFVLVLVLLSSNIGGTISVEDQVTLPVVSRRMSVKASADEGTASAAGAFVCRR